jgi:SAM-dependent methyltransferase
MNREGATMGESINIVSTSIYNEEYFEKYGHDRKHYCGNVSIRLTLKGLSAFLVKNLPNLRGQRHLDVGCAFGFLVQYMREKGVYSYGLDVSEYAIRNAVPEARRYVWVQDITQRPIDDKYDLITCVEVIEHIPCQNELMVLTELVRKSKYFYLSSEYNLDEPTHVNCKPLSYWISVMWELGYVPKTEVYAGIPWGRIYYKPTAMKFLEEYLKLHTQEEIWRRDRGNCVMCGRKTHEIRFLVPREEFNEENLWEAYAHWNRALLCNSCFVRLENSSFLEAALYKLKSF